jgi:hypothetical protein
MQSLRDDTRASRHHLRVVAQQGVRNLGAGHYTARGNYRSLGSGIVPVVQERMQAVSV